ncbi:MAG TPA: hypothetical protein VGQ47_01105 [Candidatus Limnocylindrales bacterium]|nr:hypothetical protein [Candidatus Limnocylindrales bacterium]
MAITDPAVATRRSLLAAGGGALLAFVAQAIGRPAGTRANDGDAVLAGSDTTATTTTSVTTTGGNGLLGSSSDGGGASGLRGESSGVFSRGVYGSSSGASGYGVEGVGKRGVYGHSTDSVGVFAEDVGTGFGLIARAQHGLAIDALAFGPGPAIKASLQPTYAQGSAIYAEGSSTPNPTLLSVATGSAAAIHGHSGALPATTAPTKTGVYGYAAQDANARGVMGQTTVGRGVQGQATSGIGGYFTATTGTALRAEGPVRFKTSGLATILAGTNSVVVTPGVDLTAISKILTTLQGNPGGSTVIQRVSVDTTANTFRIYLTANSVANVKVSWFVMS